MSNNIRRRKKQRLFTKDLEQMLYSLGDGPYSMDSTVNALEEALVEYLSDLSMSTSIYARSKNRSRIKIDDLPFSLRNDPYKLSRLEYIINQQQKIENAKKIFDEDDRKLMADYEESEEENPEPKEKKKKDKVSKPKKKKTTT